MLVSATRVLRRCKDLSQLLMLSGYDGQAARMETFEGPLLAAQSGI
jgi:hypothetical protein